jgi:ABC-type branched-subunit amino acid transport system ATPase component
MTAPILDISGLSIDFGGVHAVADVAVQVDVGSVRGLIGPNGAGKTTLLNAVTRLVPPSSGVVMYRGEDLLKRAPHELARLGISRTFQNLGLIGELSVLDNVAAGLHSRHPGTLLDEFILIGRRNRFERDVMAQAWEALRFAGIDALAHRQVMSLPYGTRKAVEFARAIAPQPQLLLLDEPTAGLNPAEMGKLRDLIARLRERARLSILLITHHLEFLADVADVVTVLDLGRVIATGIPAEIRRDPRVAAAYVGDES